MNGTLRFQDDGLPDQAIELLAEVLLDDIGSAQCDLCGAYVPERHYVERHPQWAGKHVCSTCYANLCEPASEDQDDAGEQSISS